MGFVDLDRPQCHGSILAWLICLSAGLFFLDFNLNAAQLSWMSSAFLWADILFLIPAGIILDRFSTRAVILWALLICVIGTFGFAWSNTFWVAFFFHFLSGIGNAFCFLCCVVLISRWFPPRRQAFMIGLIVTMAFLGGMMAHTPFAYLTKQYGWRMSLIIDGVAGVVLLGWIYFIVQDRPANSVVPQPTVGLGLLCQNLLNVLANQQNWLAGLYTCLLNLPIMVLCALWGASYLEVVHHLSPIAASNVVSLIFIGSIIGCPLVGWLSDVTGRRKPLMIAGAVATLLTILPLFFNVILTQLALSTLFFILGVVTSTQVISYPLIAESNSEQNTGTATGVSSVIIMGGAGVAQVLFGWLMQIHASSYTNSYDVSDFKFAMWMFPLAAALALLAVGLTRETHCRRMDFKQTS
jgi:MFS family permease